MINGKIVVYTSGSWDALHAGHVVTLKKARSLGDYLIVGVSTNRLIKKYKFVEPCLPYKDRCYVVKELKCVDEIIIQKKFFDVRQLRKYHIDIIVLGKDWKNKPFPELENAVKQLECKLVFVPYPKRLNSSVIKEKIIKNAYNIIKANIKRGK